MLNRFSHHHQLDEFISNFGVVGGIFHFYSYCNRTLCKQTLDTLIKRLPAASDLGLQCLHMFHKKDARLILVTSRL